MEQKRAAARWITDAQATPQAVIEAISEAGDEAKTIDVTEAHHIASRVFRLIDAAWRLAQAFISIGAWNQFKARSSNMDTLAAIGSTIAFAQGAWASLTSAGGHSYFVEAAAIITLISVGIGWRHVFRWLHSDS